MPFLQVQFSITEIHKKNVISKANVMHPSLISGHFEVNTLTYDYKNQVKSIEIPR